MTTEWAEVLERAFATLDELNGHLRRLVAVAERISPPPPDRKASTPAGPDALSRPTLADQRQWERDEEDVLFR